MWTAGLANRSQENAQARVSETRPPTMARRHLIGKHLGSSAVSLLPSFTLLRHRPVLAIWLGQLLSVTGDRFFALAVMWVALQRSGPMTMGLVAIAESVPYIAMGAVGHPIVSRFVSFRRLAGVDAVRAGLTVLLPFAWMEAGTPAMLAVVAALGGLGAVFDPALSALVPELVDEPQRPVLVALMDLTTRLARIGGPALAGVLLAVAPMTALFVADAATFAVSAVALALLGRTLLVVRTQTYPDHERPAGAGTLAPACAAAVARESSVVGRFRGAGCGVFSECVAGHWITGAAGTSVGCGAGTVRRGHDRDRDRRAGGESRDLAPAQWSVPDPFLRGLDGGGNLANGDRRSGFGRRGDGVRDSDRARQSRGRHQHGHPPGELRARSAPTPSGDQPSGHARGRDSGHGGDPRATQHASRTRIRARWRGADARRRDRRSAGPGEHTPVMAAGGGAREHERLHHDTLLTICGVPDQAAAASSRTCETVTPTNPSKERALRGDFDQVPEWDRAPSARIGG